MQIHNVCYFIGGTGARVAEAAVHLLASGYFSRDEDVEFIVIDKDYECKSYTDATTQIDQYNAVRRTITTAATRGSKLFKTSILKHNWSFDNIFNELVGVNSEADLKSSVISKDSDLKREEDRVLLHGLYSADEQNKPTAKGFYGHPSIGALMFKYMTKLDEFTETEKYDIATPVITRLNDNKLVKVFIVGTVFGGTGASVFSNLALYIRSKLNDEKMKENTVISGVLILPYFSILDDTDGNHRKTPLHIDSREFLPKSQVSLDHYGMNEKLIRKDSDDWIFDRIYAIGNRPYHQTSEVYSEGGKEQKSHFDYVDILAASSIFDFFSAGDDKNAYRRPDEGSNIMLFKREEGDILTWSSMPEGLMGNFLTMFRFSSFIITQVYPYFFLGDLNARSRRNNELAKNLYGHTNKGHLANVDEMVEMERIIKDVFSYCTSFVNLAYDLTFNGNNWSKHPDDPETNLNVRLFHKDYVKSLYRLSLDISGGSDDPNLLKRCINLASIKEIIPNYDRGIDNTQVQNNLNDFFSNSGNKFDKHDKPNARVGKWLAKAYDLCQ